MFDANLPTQFTEVEGHQIAYYRTGQGPTLVLIHGITTYSFIWRRLIPELKNVAKEWPDLPHTIWHLGEPVALPRPIPSGDPKMRARHQSCDLDILLSAESIREAEQSMKLRREGRE